jgi:hypothetical protein
MAFGCFSYRAFDSYIFWARSNIMNPSNQPEPRACPACAYRLNEARTGCGRCGWHTEKQNDSAKVNQTRNSVDIATADVNKKPDAQADLLAFVTDPKTIAKAVEGSMDKRLAVEAEVGLREKLRHALLIVHMGTPEQVFNLKWALLTHLAAVMMSCGGRPSLSDKVSS